MTLNFALEISKLEKLLTRHERAANLYYKTFASSKGSDTTAFQNYLKSTNSYIKLLSTKLELKKQNSAEVNELTGADVKALHNLAKIMDDDE